MRSAPRTPPRRFGRSGGLDRWRPRPVPRSNTGSAPKVCWRSASGAARSACGGGRRRRPGPRDRNGHQMDDLFEIEAGDGSLALRTRRGLDVGWLGFGPRDLLAWMGPTARGGSVYAPDLEIDLPRRASVVIEAASGDHRRRRPARRPALPDRIGRRHPARHQRQGQRRSRIRRRRHHRHREGRGHRPDGLGRPGAPGRHPDQRRGDDDQWRRQDRRPAGGARARSASTRSAAMPCSRRPATSGSR